jgi:hypothetical protein
LCHLDIYARNTHTLAYRRANYRYGHAKVQTEHAVIQRPAHEAAKHRRHRTDSAPGTPSARIQCVHSTVMYLVPRPPMWRHSSSSSPLSFHSSSCYLFGAPFLLLLDCTKKTVYGYLCKRSVLSPSYLLTKKQLFISMMSRR